MRRLTTARILNLHYDVLREIFEKTALLKDGRKTLAASARSCRAFQDAALDVLWSNLDGLDPLLSLLDLKITHEKAADIEGLSCRCDEGFEGYVCEACCIISDHDTLVLGGPIQSPQWSRFKTYAHRVQYLNLSEYRRWIHPSVFAAVLEQAGEAVVLPALRSFKWAVDCGSHSGPLSFLPIGLHSIVIECNPVNPKPFKLRWTESDVLRAIKSRCPHIRDLTVDPCIDFSSETLVSFRGLGRLVFADSIIEDTIASNLVRTAGCMEVLEHLEIPLPRDAGHDTFSAISSATFYHALKDLTLFAGQSWCEVASFLATVSSSRLRVLFIDSSQSLRSMGWFRDGQMSSCRICNSVVSLSLLAQRWSTSLQALSLNLRDMYKPQAYVTSLPHLLNSIYPLRRLKRLVIILGDIVEDTDSVLGDHDVRMMAESWPDIHILCVEVYKAHRNIAVMSLQSLLTFASSSPRLRKMIFPSLFADTHPAASYDTVQIHRNASFDFRYLHIHRLLPAETRDASVKFTAAQLCIAFPKLLVDKNMTMCNEEEDLCDWGLLSRAMQQYRKDHPSVL